MKRGNYKMLSFPKVFVGNLSHSKKQRDPEQHPLRMTGCSAFTLIELLVVVLIIGVLSAIALPQYNLAVEKARLAEAMSNAASLQKALDVWVLENGYPTKGGVCFLGENCSGQGQLVVDLETGMDCSVRDGAGCAGKNFVYEADCYTSGCYIGIHRDVSSLYQLFYVRNNTESWHGDDCDYYPDEFPLGEKICKMLEAQGNGFYACQDC